LFTTIDIVSALLVAFTVMGPGHAMD
jgi:hypothetical protein